jgi:hypothetical protein
MKSSRRVDPRSICLWSVESSAVFVPLPYRREFRLVLKTFIHVIIILYCDIGTL